MDLHKRKALCFALLATIEAFDNQIEITAAATSATFTAATAVKTGDTNRGAVQRRAWVHTRNDINWFQLYALQPSFLESGAWRALFRVSRTVFESLLCALEPVLR